MYLTMKKFLKSGEILSENEEERPPSDLKSIGNGENTEEKDIEAEKPGNAHEGKPETKPELGGFNDDELNFSSEEMGPSMAVANLKFNDAAEEEEEGVKKKDASEIMASRGPKLAMGRGSSFSNQPNSR